MERSSGAAPSPQRGDAQAGPSPLAVHVQDGDPRAAVVSLVGELDIGTIPRMESPLVEQLAQRGAVLLDLTKLSFIDSSGIGTLIKSFREAAGTPMFVLVEPNSQVEKIFGLARVGDAMPVFSDRDEALAALAELAR